MDIFKLAQQYEEEIKETESGSCKADMAKLVAATQGLATVHQIAHWTTNGVNFYEDHLLFERIYGQANEDLDSIAEKTVGIFGDTCLTLEDFVKDMNEFISKVSGNDYIEKSLNAEKNYLELITNTYNKLKDMKVITLGVDDLLMSTASSHETSVYLLQQRAGQSPNKKETANIEQSTEKEPAVEEEEDLDHLDEI